MELKEKITNWELKDTVDLMNSDNYIDRFKAEYLQTKIRLEKLEDILIKNTAGTLAFELESDNLLLEDQLYYMKEYFRVLRVRAEKEGIDVQQF